MVIFCSSSSLSDLIENNGEGKDNIFFADHDHENSGIYLAVREAIPALARHGTKHLFLEVPSSIEHLLDPKKRPLRDNPDAHALLKQWNTNPEEMIKLVDAAHEHGITVHFADDFVSLYRGALLKEKIYGAQSFTEWMDANKALIAQRSAIDPIVSKQVAGIGEKAAVVYGANHFSGAAAINAATPGEGLTIGLHSSRSARLRNAVMSMALPNVILSGHEDACVYAPPLASTTNRAKDQPGR